jgi:hypothetical protein
MKLYMFRTVPLLIIRSLFTVLSALVYVIKVCKQLSSRTWSSSKAIVKPVLPIKMPSVQWINSWWWAEELPETCRVSCRSKFGKLVHLVDFIIEKYLCRFALLQKAYYELPHILVPTLNSSMLDCISFFMKQKTYFVLFWKWTDTRILSVFPT